jgi:hypothetical protein
LSKIHLDQYLLRYSTYIGDCIQLWVDHLTSSLNFKNIIIFLRCTQFSFLIWSPQLKFKFEKDLISGCWDILLKIFWGRLQLEAIFITRNFQSWFVPLNFSLKVEEYQISGCWDISHLILWGRLPVEVVFITSNF